MKPSPEFRPAFRKTTEEMLRWAELLRQEMLSWPSVRARPMFGMTALYRGKKIFVLLPRSRAIDTPNSIAIKIHPAASRTTKKQTKSAASTWQSFELESERDLQAAMRRCERAYKSAK